MPEGSAAGDLPGSVTTVLRGEVAEAAEATVGGDCVSSEGLFTPELLIACALGEWLPAIKNHNQPNIKYGRRRPLTPIGV